MKKLILSLSDVPTTGRTTLCELLHSVWRRKGVPHSRYHTSSEQPQGPGRSRFIDLTNGLNGDEVISWLDLSSLVLLDVATGDASGVADDYVNGELPEMLAEMDCSITLLAVLNGHPRGESELLRLAEHFRNDAEYVIARPTATKRPSGGWHSAGCQRAMHHLGAMEIEVPSWPAPLATFASEGGFHALTLMDRESSWARPIQTWLQTWAVEASAALEPAADFLWPGGLDRTPLNDSDYGTGVAERTGRRRRASRKTSSAA